MGGKIGVFPNIGIETRRDSMVKICWRQQLAGVIFPTIHQKGNVIRVILENVIPISAGQGGCVFVVETVQKSVEHCTAQHHGGQEQCLESDLSAHKITSQEERA